MINTAVLADKKYNAKKKKIKIKDSHEGKLHARLGYSEGESIPKGDIQKILNAKKADGSYGKVTLSNGKTIQVTAGDMRMANFANNFGK